MRSLAKERPRRAASAESTGDAGPEAVAGATDQWQAVHAVQLGALAVRASTSRVSRLRFGLDDAVVAVQFADKNLQLYGVQSEAQLRRQVKRRLTKRRKQTAGEGRSANDDDEEDDAAEVELSAADRYQPLTHLRAGHKIHSFAFMPRQKGAAAAATAAAADGAESGETARKEVSARLLVADRSNGLGLYSCELKQGGVASLLSAVPASGHRAEPRGLALSADDRLVLSASDGEARVWSARTQQCIGTLGCKYGLSAIFVLASKYVVIGTKEGALQAFSLATSDLVAEVESAHSGAVWSLAVRPGTTTILSGSADKTIATWTPSEPSANALSLTEDARHEAGDDVMCARYTAAGKHVCLALLDASIKVLFSDSFKLFLTLYGHQLPVLSVSASSDGDLLVSGSADKTIKIWGLDFGDCHRSLHGHTESVMSVAFVRETHYFFSASKDKTIRYWDADKFEQILNLKGHHAEVWGVMPSKSGALVVSISRDRSIRLWRRGDEQVFVEEEREAELEQLFEAGLEKRQEANEAEEEEAANLGLEGGPSEAAVAGRRTIESVKGAERVLEALKVLAEEVERKQEYETALATWRARNERVAAVGAAAGSGSEPAPSSKPPVLVPNMLLLGLDEGAYLLKAISSVRSTELEQAMLLLPFESARALLERLLPLVQSAPPIELMARCILFLLKVHHKQVVASRALLTLLHDLNAALGTRLSAEHAVLGYNLAAMNFMKQSIEQSSEGKFFAEALQEHSAAAGDTIGELRRKTAAKVRGAQRGSAKKRKQPTPGASAA